MKVQASTFYSAAEKAQTLDIVYRQMIFMAKNANNIIRSVQKTYKRVEKKRKK